MVRYQHFWEGLESQTSSLSLSWWNPLLKEVQTKSCRGNFRREGSLHHRMEWGFSRRGDQEWLGCLREEPEDPACLPCPTPPLGGGVRGVTLSVVNKASARFALSFLSVRAHGCLSSCVIGMKRFTSLQTGSLDPPPRSCRSLSFLFCLHHLGIRRERFGVTLPSQPTAVCQASVPTRNTIPPVLGNTWAKCLTNLLING